MKKIVRGINEWLLSFLIALIAVLIINQFFVIATIDGRSMQPTYYTGDHVITAKHFTTLDYNDVIGFHFINDLGEEEYHVKRIIGKPGDLVEVNGVQILVNGEVVIEDGIVDYGQQSYQLSDTQYFVVGDNYEVSLDSRKHGPIEESDILGEVILDLPF